MKPLVTILSVGSLILNAVLVVVLFAGRNSEPPAPAVAPRINPAPKAPALVINEEVWQGLRADNLPRMLQQLREAGFPIEIVRAILAAQVRESFAARRKAIDPEAETRPFWKSPYVDPKVFAAMRQLDREQQKIMRDLLGPDAESPFNNMYQGRRLESVPTEKASDVRQVLRDFDDLRSDIFGMGGIIGPEQQKKLAALENDQQAALARFLTPQELEEFNLRNSDTSRQVRYQLSAFDPTEDEFKAIYRFQAEFDKQFGRMYALPSPQEQQRRDEAQQQLNEQIKAVLGPVRSADYDRANDYSYRQTSQLVTRLELPAETTGQVWATKKEFEERAAVLQRDTAIAAEDRTRQLAALADEATKKLTGLLGGSRGMEAYKQYGGYWLRNFVPRTPPTPNR